MKKIVLLMLCLCSVLTTACASFYSSYNAEEYQQGKAYFKNGDYKRAYHTLLPIAVCSGCAEAEYAVGYLIYYGYGVERDPEIGMFWIRRAALQNYAPAVKAMRTMSPCK